MIGSAIKSPSVESLRKQLKISLSSAQLIKQACNQGKAKSALKIASDAMEGFGIESGWPEHPNFSYVNVGDAYTTTLYFTGSSIMIGSWGDYMERHRGVSTDGSNPRDSKHWKESKHWR